MTQYTMEEISALVRMDAAWARESKQTRARMVAHIMCESSGNPNASNSVMGGHYGLAQISKSNWASLFTKYQWNNPRDNIAMAHIVFAKQKPDFSPWLATKACAAAKYLQALQWENKPARAPSGVNVSDIPGPTTPLTPSVALPPGYEKLEPLLSPINAIGNAIQFLADPANWLRLATFVAGGFVLLLGVLFLIGSNKGVQKAASFVPAGRVVKVARKVAA